MIRDQGSGIRIMVTVTVTYAASGQLCGVGAAGFRIPAEHEREETFRAGGLAARGLVDAARLPR